MKPRRTATAPARAAGLREAAGAWPAEVPVYGVDAMVFAYAFEWNQEFGPHAKRVLASAEDGRCRLVSSVLSLLEVLVLPKRLGDELTCRRYRQVFRSFPGLALMSADEDIAEAAAGLRAAYGLRTPDALHVATAIRAGAVAFVSGDLDLGRVREIPVIPLADFPGREGASP